MTEAEITALADEMLHTIQERGLTFGDVERLMRALRIRTDEERRKAEKKILVMPFGSTRAHGKQLRYPFA